jgi:hypothetical protein
VRVSKDVIFDDKIDFHNDTVSPSDSDFNRGIDEQERIVPVVPAPMPVIAPSVQPIPAPVPSIAPSPIIPKALSKALPRQDAPPYKAPVARTVVPPPKPAGLLGTQSLLFQSYYHPLYHRDSHRHRLMQYHPRSQSCNPGSALIVTLSPDPSASL